MATKEKKGGFFSMLKGHSKSKESETLKKAIDDPKDSPDSKSVKRRDSAKLPSASKLLRSLRPDRTSPAYHSEGKGLRKRKQAWTSERDLPQGEGKKTAERSRSFSERPKFESVQDLTILSSQTDSTFSEFDNSGVEKSFVDNVYDETETVDDAKKVERKKKENDVKRERQERKLTKDSGYETSNSDYANPDALKSIREVENSTESIYANLQEIQEGYSARETNFFGCEEESPKASPQNACKTDGAFGPEKPASDDTICPIETEKNTDRNHEDKDEPYLPPQRPETVQMAAGMTGSKSTPNLDAKSRGAESPLTRASWDWSNTDEEYASQLRSVLLGHNRQPSSLSSSSSHSRQISSISDEGILSSSDQRSRPLSESLSHLSASSGGDRYFSFDHLDDVGLPQQWDPVPISPLHRSPPPPPVRDMSSLKYARSQSQTHEKYPSWPMPQRPEGEPAHSQRSKSWTEHTEYPKESVPVYSRIYGRRPLPIFNQQLKPVIENLGHEHYELSPVPSPEPPSSVSRYTDPDYARYDDFRSYSQSEGYSSYVSSEASYVSNSSSTPLLDRLRLESEVVRPEIVRNSPSSVTGRDSVTTVVTNSSSGSSNDTQKIHGSYSDLSAYNMSNRQNVAHSSRVQLPQRHNSESVLFYAQDRRRTDEKKKYPVQTYDVPSEKDHVLRSPAIDTSKLAPVSERIFQLERQSKSVPNLIDKSPNKPVKSPQKENLAYLDPEKRMQVAEPTLKQIQKQALMNYYERKVSSKMRSEFRKQASYDALSNYQNADVFLKEEHERKFGVDHRHNQENYVNFNPSLHAYHTKTSEESLPVVSSTFPEIDPVPNDIQCGNESGAKAVQPPERPPKKPHMRAPPASLPTAQRAAPQQPIGSTNSSSSVSPTHLDARPILKKPPAPEPPVRPDVESRVPPYHGRWEESAPRRSQNHLPLDESARGAPPPYPGNDSPPALPARISPTFSEPISGSYLKPPAFQDPPPVLPLRLSPSVSETRSTTPDLPPPPPHVVSEGVVQDEPLPPPPSPLLASNRSKSPYAESEPDREIPPKVIDGFSGLETSTTSSGWEKQHNVRSSGTTVIFTSEELAKIKEKQKMVQKSTVENTYRSELIIFPATDPVEVELPPSGKIQSEEVTLSSHVGTLPRSKRPEEIECDQLSVELANHLPASDKLKAILGGPELKTTSDYVEKIFGMSQSGSPLLNCENETAEPEIVRSNEHLTRSVSQTNTTLPSNSVYFTTSESKAKLLNQYSEDIEKQKKEPLDPSLILQKKEDLVKRLDKKLEILRFERQAIHEDMLTNDNLGKDVSSRVAAVATSVERNKVALHIVEVEKITALLLGLAGRLARAQNALASLGENADLQERAMLESKRDKLVEQLDEARALKESIDKRSRNVSNLLQKYFTDEECADYEHFVSMKAKLAVDAKEIDEKIKLGEEQLLALKETLNVS